MNARRNRLGRLRSMSAEQRSRSVTPTAERAKERPSVARRALLMGLVASSAPTEPSADASPPRKKIRGLEVDCTPGGSMYVTDNVVGITRTPGGSLRRASTATSVVPLCSNVLERVEAMDVSEDEAEELLAKAPWHVRRWMKTTDMEGQECSLSRPLMSSTCTDANLDRAGFGSVRAANTTVGQHEEVSCVELDVAVIPDVEIRPSTSGMTSRSKPVPRNEACDGSDFDSEFDDEFDITPIEIPAFTGNGKDIPDDEELEEPIRDIINNIGRGMDDEADRLLGISSSFIWVQGFDSFRGVPEQFSGPTPGPIRDYDSAYEAFTDIWDKSIIDRIVLETNRYAKQTIDALKEKGELKPSSRMRQWTDTDADEMMVLFGIFMYMAIDPRASQEEYWRSGILEMPNFKCLMSYNRYVLLSKFLHFVDNSDMLQNSHQTEGMDSTKQVMSRRLFKLSPIIEYLGEKFNCLYYLGRNLSIDESLTLFKGRLSWVQTIRSKAARFGIKSYELCESQTGYMARFQIYTGKSDTTDPSLSVDLGGKSTKVVLELLQGLERRGHCVTMDNFYNCPALARYLKSLGFDCLGTLRANRRNVPNDIAKIPKNVPKGTIISRQCGDVSIVSWKDSKLVNIISTYHDDDTFVGSKAGKTLVKPVCVKDYNSTMGGIDLKDQKLSMYLLERKRGVKWYIKMFKRLLNVSIHNAFIMYVGSLKRRNKMSVTHREFRYELANSMVDTHRPGQLKISKPVGQLMRLRRDIVHVPKYETGGKNRKRCVLCLRMKINKMVHSQCSTCDVFLCFENCWEKWHSSHRLEGQEIRGRKRRRDE